MNLQVYKPSEPKEEPTLIDMQQDDEGVNLVVVNVDGERRTLGFIGWLSPDGLHLATGLDPALGFPLDGEGRIKVVT